jgi:transcription elongation factor Elf1
MMSTDKPSAPKADKQGKTADKPATKTEVKAPKKVLHKVSSVSKMKILTKDAKQMVNGPYYCPKCKKELLQMFVDARNKKAYAVCKCGLEWELTYAPIFQGVDYYNKFRDAWKKQSYGIIKPQPKKDPAPPKSS